jgi:excinuclease UvrABC ATPase subunit
MTEETEIRQRTLQIEEMVLMVSKSTCPACKGNRYVTVKDSGGRDLHKKCPECGGRGFKVTVQR